MKLRILGLTVLLFAGAAAAQQIAQPVKITSAEAKCEITFPGKPLEKSDKNKTQAVLEMPFGGGAYLFHLNALPNDVSGDKDAVKKVFDAGREGLRRTLNGSRVIAEKDLMMGKLPAHDVDLELPNGGIYRVRFVLTPKYFCQVTVRGPKDFVDGAAAFRDSFKLKE